MFDLKKGQGEPKKALEDYDQAIQKNDKEFNFYMGSGWIKYQQLDILGAILDYNTAIFLAPFESKIYYYRAHVLFQQFLGIQQKKDMLRAKKAYLYLEQFVAEENPVRSQILQYKSMFK